MIELKWKKFGIPVTHVWFSEHIPVMDILGIARYSNYRGSKKPAFMVKHTTYTLETDLTLGKDTIFAQFKSNVRNEIRKTEKMGFDFGINKISIEQYVSFFNVFAEAKCLSRTNELEFTQYKTRNITLLSAHEKDGELMVVHVYLIDGNIARLLHSCSQIHTMNNEEKRKKIGFFNRRLHWEDILYFKQLGYTVYDWGGYSHKFDDKTLMGINAFKKSFGGNEKEVKNYRSLLRIIFDLSHRNTF